MLSLSKDGTIRHSDRIICNRIGLTPEFSISAGQKINVNTNNGYTISRMNKGLLLSFYSIPGIFSQAWFHSNGRSYFLSTLNRIDGYKSFWKGHLPFGEILNKDYLTALDVNFAWTFFLHYSPSEENKKYILTILWDIVGQKFIHPTKWPKFLDSDRSWVKKIAGSSLESIFKFDPRELNFLSVVKNKQFSNEHKFSYPNWVKIQSSLGDTPNK